MVSSQLSQGLLGEFCSIAPGSLQQQQGEDTHPAATWKPIPSVRVDLKVKNEKHFPDCLLLPAAASLGPNLQTNSLIKFASRLWTDGELQWDLLIPAPSCDVNQCLPWLLADTGKTKQEGETWDISSFCLGQVVPAALCKVWASRTQSGVLVGRSREQKQQWCMTDMRSKAVLSVLPKKLRKREEKYITVFIQGITKQATGWKRKAQGRDKIQLYKTSWLGKDHVSLIPSNTKSGLLEGYQPT